MTQLLADRHVEQGREWAERSHHWLEANLTNLPKRKLRQRNPSPLILCGHGVSMRIENGALIIRDGFTHYPQQRVSLRFFRGDLALPPRIILLDGSGTLSFDVLSWLGEQDVALARVKWTGEVATVAGGSGYAADRRKVDWQLETRDDKRKRLAYATDLIGRKFANSVETLQTCFPASDLRERAIAKAHNGQKRLAEHEHSDLNDVRSVEGECAVAYFRVWSELPIGWTGTRRHPIPDAWRAFRSRSSLTSGKVPKNRMASHPVNAMLNYAYSVRQAQLQIQAVADGYDPTIGIMHNRHQGSPAFILDQIEPERPRVDAAVLNLIQSRSFSGADFVIRADGVCRLSPQLARVVASLVA